jgi:DNA-binding MarR family transcriptional regulator
MTSSFDHCHDDGTDSLGVLVGLVRSEMVRALERDMTAQGTDLRYTQYMVLKRLATMGTMSASELARAVDLDGGAMTRLLDQLADKGYLRRCPNALDRRALRIELTDAGEALWKHLYESSRVVLDRAQVDLDADERSRLTDYLQRVLNALRTKV